MTWKNSWKQSATFFRWRTHIFTGDVLFDEDRFGPKNTICRNQPNPMIAFRNIFRVCSVALVAFVFISTSTPATAQTKQAEGQEYKIAFNEGVEAARAKNYQSAIDLLTAAAEGATAEGDAEVIRRSYSFISKFEYTLGLGLMRADSFDGAIARFESGIEKDPAYPKNYLAKASALKKKGELHASMIAFAEAASKADAANDSKTARQAKTSIRDHYVFLAATALSRNGARTSSADADEAYEALMLLQNFVTEEDSDVLYYTAEINKVKGEYAEAVRFADQALAIHRGSRTDKAKIFYVKGESLVALGDTPGAKEAFQGAAFGSYKASAEHFLETLGSSN